MRYHFTPVRMATNKKTGDKKGWWGCGEKGTLVQCWWECKLVQPLWETVQRFFQKLKIEPPYDPAILLLTMHLKEMKSLSQRDICTPMFTAALFTIANTWKQPKFPSADEWIKNMWYVYTMGYYSAIKKKKILPFATRWMDLEGTILSETNQTEKDKYCILSLIFGI